MKSTIQYLLAPCKGRLKCIITTILVAVSGGVLLHRYGVDPTILLM